MAEFEAVIGLEIHAQLATETKMFCGCPAKPSTGSVGEDAVNSRVCPICTAQPGTLPAINARAVEFAIRAGLALGCTIRTTSVFSRKNYFYPDLPKGYQISQYDLPICENGMLKIETSKGEKTIRVQRIHMEEDAGKNIHLPGYSVVNLNRAGTPLIEIVSQPDLRSPEEAGAYMREMYSVITTLGVCDGNLQEGNFRCDANVSVMPKGSSTFGTRAEIKNVNSFRFVEKAIEYEIQRQIDVVTQGGRVVQETRLYDSAKNITQSMRSKEEAHDYRYFPEPDLGSVNVPLSLIEEIRKSLPELPQAKRERYIQQLGLSPYDAGVMTRTPGLAAAFDACMQKLEKAEFAKAVSNLLTGEVLRLCNEADTDLASTKLTTAVLVDVVKSQADHTLSSTAAKQVLVEIFKNGGDVKTTVERLGLAQVNDASSLLPIVREVVAKFPGQAAEFRSGKDKLLGFFVGHAMKATQGKANPGILQDLLKKALSESV